MLRNAAHALPGKHKGDNSLLSPFFAISTSAREESLAGFLQPAPLN
jgi:hypothetical protein